LFYFLFFSCRERALFKVVGRRCYGVEWEGERGETERKGTNRTSKTAKKTNEAVTHRPAANRAGQNNNRNGGKQQKFSHRF
jgi:hypothetical protein